MSEISIENIKERKNEFCPKCKGIVFGEPFCTHCGKQLGDFTLDTNKDRMIQKDLIINKSNGINNSLCPTCGRFAFGNYCGECGQYLNLEVSEIMFIPTKIEPSVFSRKTYTTEKTKI